MGEWVDSRYASDFGKCHTLCSGQAGTITGHGPINKVITLLVPMKN